MSITWSDFEKVDIRVGKVLEVKDFPEGKYSTHIVKIDFGKEIGTKKSLARLAPNYIGPELIGRQIIAVVNFEPKQIGRHQSDALILGLADAQGNVVLVFPEQAVPLGEKLH